MSEFKYPRVTQIIKETTPPEDLKGLIRWQKKMDQIHGTGGAEKQRQQILDNGTALHLSIENYLKGKPETNSHEWLPYVQPLLNKVKNSNLIIEKRLFSDVHQFTGKPDCVSEDFNSKVTIFDWRSSAKLKKRKYIEDKFLQAGAYAIALQEKTSINVEQLAVVVVVGATKNYQIFLEEPDPWKEKFLERLEQYNNLKKEGKLSN